MDQQFATLTRSLSGLPSRRHLLRGLAAAGLGWGVARLPDAAAANKKRKPKRKKDLCQKNGSPCTKPGKNCQKRYCLRAPFTIAAKWTQSTSDHDTYLFVPPEDGTTGPFPYINFGCNPGASTCEEAYPFACVSQDAGGPGDEITTIHRLLPGTYEYWIELYDAAPAGELTIVLKDSGDRVVREWTNPANTTPIQAGWHVFDVDKAGRVTSIDDLSDTNPRAAHDPSTRVCP